MRQQTTPDQPSMPEHPSVIIGVPRQKKWTKPGQNYKGVLTKYQFKEPDTIKFFNSILHGEPYDIYGFFAPEFEFAEPDSLTLIVDHFKKWPEIQAVYSDYSVKERQFYLEPYPFPDTTVFINGKARFLCQFLPVERTYENILLQIQQKGLLVKHLAELVATHS